MEKYSRLYYFDSNLYIKNSPIIICAGAILKDNYNNNIVAQLKFKNISPKAIKALTVVLQLKDPSGRSLKDEIEHQYLDLNAFRDFEFGSKEAIKVPYNNSRSFTVYVKEVIFSDGKIWSNSKKKWDKLPSQEKLDTKLNVNEIKTFKDIYNLDNSYVNQEINDFHSINEYFIPLEYKDIWLCTCGYVGLENETICHRCGFSKDNINNIDFEEIKKETLYTEANRNLNSYSIKNVLYAKEDFIKLKDYKDSVNKINECDKKIEKLNDDIQKGKEVAKHLAKVISIIVLIIIIFVCVFLFIKNIVVPNVNYSKANKLLENKKYSEAINYYNKLGDYKDSNEKLIKAKINKAIELAEKDNYDEAFNILKDVNHNDRTTTLNDINYKYAEYLMESDPDMSYEIFTHLESYKNSEEKAIVAAINSANKYKEEEDYKEAYEWYVKGKDEISGLDLLYSYVNENKDNRNEKTYEYLKILIEKEYKNSQEIYDKLYKKSAIIVVNNDAKSFELTKSISKKDFNCSNLYIHYKVSGLTPEENVTVYVNADFRFDFSNRFNEYSGGVINKKIDFSKSGEWQTVKLSDTDKEHYKRLLLNTENLEWLKYELQIYKEKFTSNKVNFK